MSVNGYKEVPQPPKPIIKPQHPLAGQTALVTGANSGIGEGCAKILAGAGADVVVNYVVHPEAAEQVVDAIRQTGRKAVAIKADVSREDEVRQMFERAIQEFGALDILINNAGLQDDAPFDEMTLEQWNHVISVNLTGQFLCAREAVRIFRKQGVREGVSCAAGKIICISSVHEVIPWAGHVNYAASKGGVMLMMKSIAQEVAKYRVRVNAIAPGAIRTPINRQSWADAEEYRSLLHLMPYGRIGEPEDIGRAAAWLASDDSDYVTGTSLYVDGGMTLYPGFATGG